MDPEVRQDQPGACPKCGMALEPDLSTGAADTDRIHLPDASGDRPRRARARARSAAWRSSRASSPLDDGPNPELDDMTRRILDRPRCSVCPSSCWRWATWCWAWALGGRIDMRLTNWIGLVCATPVVLWAGWPFFERGWASIVNRNANMFTLIALGVGAAYSSALAGNARAGHLSRRLPRPRRRRNLLRHGGRDHRARAARPGARAARARPDERGDPRSCSAWRRRRRACIRRRRRGRRAARRRRRSATCFASGRARRSRSTASSSRAERGRRIDGDRRADAGREERRAAASPAARSTARAA